MTFAVLLTEDAARDLEHIHDYVVRQDGARQADRLLDQIEQTLARLAEQPDRGSYPRELLELGIREYRQLVFAPYRLIYRVVDGRVIAYLIADSRRDMQSLLARRLL